MIDHPLTSLERIDYILSATDNRDLFIETGTADGYTANAMSDHFAQVYSIELVTRTYNDAIVRFANVPNVKIVHGDSAPILFRLIPRLERSFVLWLDAHDNGELPDDMSRCPVMGELEVFFYHRIPQCSLFIDDVHLFGVDPDYPSVEEIQQYVLSKGMNYRAYVDQGVIRIEDT